VVKRKPHSKGQGRGKEAARDTQNKERQETMMESETERAESEKKMNVRGTKTSL